jgi:hypothetical protein
MNNDNQTTKQINEIMIKKQINKYKALTNKRTNRIKIKMMIDMKIIMILILKISHNI